MPDCESAVERDTDALREAVALAVGERDVLGDALGEPDARGDADAVRDPEVVPEPEKRLLPLRLAEPLALADADADAERLVEGLCDAAPLTDAEPLSDARLALALVLGERDASDADTVPDAVTLALTSAEPEQGGEADAEPDSIVAVADAEREAPAVTAALGDTATEAVTVALALGHALGERLAATVGDGYRVDVGASDTLATDADADSDALTETAALCEGATEPDAALALAHALGERLAAAVRDGTAVGVTLPHCDADGDGNKAVREGAAEIDAVVALAVGDMSGDAVDGGVPLACTGDGEALCDADVQPLPRAGEAEGVAVATAGVGVAGAVSVPAAPDADAHELAPALADAEGQALRVLLCEGELDADGDALGDDVTDPLVLTVAVVEREDDGQPVAEGVAVGAGEGDAASGDGEIDPLVDALGLAPILDVADGEADGCSVGPPVALREPLAERDGSFE